MKRIHYLYIGIFFLFSSSLFAENNVLIHGKINHVELIKEIEIKVDERYINGTVDSYTVPLSGDNTFALRLEVKAPQRVQITYSRNTTEIYLEPFDTLYIDIDAQTFPYGLSFSGKGAENNLYFMKYNEENPRHKNQFEYMQYRSGIFWYFIPPRQDAMMKQMSKENYANSMILIRKKRLEALEKYEKENSNALSIMFQEFMRAEINYFFGYHILCYGNIFKTMHDVERDFYSLIYGLPLDNSQIGNYYYREYLKAYINHLYMDLNDGNIIGIIDGQYQLASTQLDELPLAYFQSELITKALRSKKIDDIIENYNHYLENNPYYEFNEKIIAAYQKAIKYHIGSPAPDFNLITRDGKGINLSVYQGRPIFISFWASWCQPCMKKMKELKTIQPLLEEQGVIFLNISFDRNQEVWNTTVDKNNFGGVHVFSKDGIASKMAQDYNVRALPQYYIIDKNGKFAELPKKNDIEALKLKLQLLVQ